MQIRRYKIIAGIFIFLAINLIYLFTTSLDYQWGDGIELTISSNKLGVCHPTGYPLYAIIGKIFTSLPFGTIAFRMHYFSAVTSSLTVLFLFLILYEILRITLKNNNQGMTIFHLTLIAALSFLLGISRDFWMHSNVAEVYSLSCLFMVLFIYLAIRFLITNSMNYLITSAFIIGLGLTNHLLMVALVPVFLMIVWMKRRVITPKILIISVFFLFVGLSCYIYLLIRALKSPIMNWGNPINLKNFLWVITGEQFKITRYSLTNGIGFLNELLKAFLLIGEQWFDLTDKTFLLKASVSGLILIVFIIALFYIVKKNRAVGLLIITVFIFTFALTMTHRIPDNEGYFLINYACIIIAVSSLVINLLSSSMINKLSRRVSISIILIAFIIAIYITNLSYCNRKDYFYAENYGKFVMRGLAPDSMIITGGDNDIYSLWYQKYIENNRKDVTIFGANFIASKWYQNYFREELESGRIKIAVAEHIFITDMDYLQFLAREILEPNLDNMRIYSTYMESNPAFYNSYKYILCDAIGLGWDNKFYKYIAQYAIPSGAIWRIERNKSNLPFFFIERE